MELEPRGSISTDNLGPQRKKRISKRSSKKSSKKKDRDRERERAEAEIGFIAGELPPAGEKADVHPQVSGWDYVLDIFLLLRAYIDEL